MAHILIADDDPVIIKLLQVNLEMEGYDVTTAHDGQDALEKATALSPDLIVLDIMMPRMDGLTARMEIKKVPHLAETPVIFLSAKAQQGDLRRGHELGVAEYITKPFDPMDFLSIVDQILKGTYTRPKDTR
ncbi:MAG: response regulator [Actinomycetota bacterium]